MELTVSVKSHHVVRVFHPMIVLVSRLPSVTRASTCLMVLSRVTLRLTVPMMGMWLPDML